MAPSCQRDTLMSQKPQLSGFPERVFRRPEVDQGVGPDVFGISRDALWAFGVHILTASGAFFAFLSLVAAAEKDFTKSFLWMGIALAVDGVDGPLARRLEVKKWWPHWSGDMLDAVIDYVTYVMIPAFLLYQSGLMGKYVSFVAAAVREDGLDVVSGLYNAAFNHFDVLQHGEKTVEARLIDKQLAMLNQDNTWLLARGPDLGQGRVFLRGGVLFV